MFVRSAMEESEMALMGRICLHIGLGNDFAVFLCLICGDCLMEPSIIALLSPGAFQGAQDCENQVKDTKVMTSGVR